MRHSGIRSQAFVVALLISVIYASTRERAVAVVLVGTDIRDASVGRTPCRSTVLRLGEVNVCHVAESGGVVTRVIERHVDVSGDCIDCKPVVEAIDRAELVRGGLRSRPAGGCAVS